MRNLEKIFLVEKLWTNYINFTESSPSPLSDFWLQVNELIVLLFTFYLKNCFQIQESL